MIDFLLGERMAKAYVETYDSDGIAGKITAVYVVFSCLYVLGCGLGTAASSIYKLFI